MATREEIYLAALLHDIGKFWQRADENWDETKEFSGETKKMIELIARSTQRGYPTYQHVIWTYEFFNRYAPLKTLANLASRHHRPSCEDEAIIQLADWWASGIERTYVDEEKLKLGTERYKKQPIGNIFSRVMVNGQKAEEKHAFLLSELTIEDEKVFPVPFTEEYANSRKANNDLWIKFISDFEKTKDWTDSRNFAQTLFFILKKHCWSIPAATNEAYPVSSLFEHSKVTAALAWCFKVFMEAEPNGFKPYDKTGKLLLNESCLPLLLVCVDLSGIQKFIYDIASKYAAKSLRGRSFYLQAVLSDLARELMHRTGAYHSNIIYSSGGKFFMLLPNTKAIKDILDVFEKEVIKKLWDKYRGSLYLCFGRIAFAYDNTMKDEKQPRIIIENKDEKVFLGDLWKEVIHKTSAKKQKRFSSLLLTNEGFNELFKPSDTGGIADICEVTGLEGKTITGIDDESNRHTVAEYVNEQTEIGKALPMHVFLVYGTEKSYVAQKKTFEMISGHRLIIEREKPATIDNAEIYFTLREKCPGFMGGTIVQKNSYGFSYFGGATQPLNNSGDVKTFENMVDDCKVRKIGILRMDIDNLGQLFTHGFLEEGKDRASFSNYATLSGMLDLFFSGYINTIRDKAEFSDWISIVYSGGDDLFAVGRWDKIIGFARAVIKDFRRFTGREDITISAGIEITGPRFPIGKAALLASEAEEKAKSYVYRDYEKNALCLFGIVVNWDLEYNRVEEIKNKLIQWIESGFITKSLLMQLLGYYEKWMEGGRSGQSWKWHVAYNLARREKASKSQAREALAELKKILFTEINDNHLRFDAFALATRWAELEYKNSN